MKIDPNAPAHVPVETVERNNHGDYRIIFTSGMTIRAEIASRLLAGIISSPKLNTDDMTVLAADSVAFADALIAELNREEQP